MKLSLLLKCNKKSIAVLITMNDMFRTATINNTIWVPNDLFYMNSIYETDKMKFTCMGVANALIPSLIRRLQGGCYTRRFYIELTLFNKFLCAIYQIFCFVNLIVSTNEHSFDSLQIL